MLQLETALQQIASLFRQHAEWLYVSSDGTTQSLRRDEIDIAIIIKIEELQPPSTHELGGSADARRQRHVVESFVMIVLVNREHFPVEV